MTGILNFWRGYKTKILSAIGILSGFAFAMGWIDEKTAAAIGMLIGSSGLATLRQAISTEVADVVAKVEKVETKVVIVDTKVATVAPAVAKVAEQVQDIKDVVGDTPVLFTHQADCGAPHVICP